MALSERGSGDEVVVGMEGRPNYSRLLVYTRNCHSGGTCYCTRMKHGLGQEKRASERTALTEGGPEACCASTPRYRRVHATNTGSYFLGNRDVA